MEEPELENEGAVTKGERDAKSIVASRDSCCLADSDACACAGVPPGVDALLVMRDEGLFIGVDDGEATVGDEEAATAPGDQETDIGCAARLDSGIAFPSFV